MYNHQDLKDISLDHLEDNKLYVVGVLRKCLKDAGLPSSMYAIMGWEAKGIIPKFRSNLNGWRMYKGSEIRDFIALLSQRSS
jgi:hypothetical protein